MHWQSLTCDMVDQGEEESDLHAVSERPDASIKVSTEVPEHSVDIAFAAP